MFAFRPRNSSRGPWRGKHPSRQLGLEIFVLAGLAAIVPMLIIAGVVFAKAENSLREQALSGLRADAGRYAITIAERLTGSFDLLERLAAGPSAPLDQTVTQFDAVAVVARSGHRLFGTLNPPSSLLALAAQNNVAQLSVVDEPAQGSLYLVRGVGDRVAIGQL